MKAKLDISMTFESKILGENPHRVSDPPRDTERSGVPAHARMQVLARSMPNKSYPCSNRMPRLRKHHLRSFRSSSSAVVFACRVRLQYKSARWREQRHPPFDWRHPQPTFLHMDEWKPICEHGRKTVSGSRNSIRIKQKRSLLALGG